ncbi:MAG: hypothetical protein KJP07_13605 [Desulfatitalea sp.]|nr:hypothetical protein [Desulfatitalea sp.]
MGQQSLEDFKKEVETKEVDQQEGDTGASEYTDTDTDTSTDDNEGATDEGSDEGGKHVGGDDEQEPEIEPWMKTESESTDSKDVPVHTHIKIKQKLKGRISDQKDELAALRKELESLKAGSAGVGHSNAVMQVQGSKIKRPMPVDFSSDDDYEAARVRYEDEMYRERQQRIQMEEAQKAKLNTAKANMEKAVSDHYDRAADLVEKHKIDPDAFRSADVNFRSAIESIRPGNGDLLADKFIEVCGEGSEKVFYHLGVNEASRGQFVSKLIEDPTGLKAMAFIGHKKAELTNPKQRTISRAPKPAAQHRGDGKTTPANAAAFKKAHDKAERSNDLQGQFNARRDARKAGVDISKW